MQIDRDVLKILNESDVVEYIGCNAWNDPGVDYAIAKLKSGKWVAYSKPAENPYDLGNPYMDLFYAQVKDYEYFAYVHKDLIESELAKIGLTMDDIKPGRSASDAERLPITFTTWKLVKDKVPGIGRSDAIGYLKSVANEDSHYAIIAYYLGSKQSGNWSIAYCNYTDDNFNFTYDSMHCWQGLPTGKEIQEYFQYDSSIAEITSVTDLPDKLIDKLINLQTI